MGAPKSQYASFPPFFRGTQHIRKKKKKKPGESCDNNNKNILWQRLRENLEKLKKKKKKKRKGRERRTCFERTVWRTLRSRCGFSQLLNVKNLAVRNH